MSAIMTDDEMAALKPGPLVYVPAPDNSPAGLLLLAVQRGADVDQLSKLMDLQERWQREEARRAYFSAKSRFQAICPEITKDREVSFGAGKTQYKYATLAGIIRQVKEPLANCDLTYRWEIHDTAESIQVTCILSHRDGHSEQNTMSAQPDASGSKNAIQERGSTVSYLQRYTLIGALGIASANEDDDGRAHSPQGAEVLMKHNAAVRDFWETIYTIKMGIRETQLETAIEAWDEMDEETKRALWIAQTKGGIFTTREREVIKSDEWSAARRAMKGQV